MPKPSRHVLVCINSRPPGHPKGSCASRDAEHVLSRFQEEFDRKELFGKVLLTKTGCMGPCGVGPIVVVYPEGSWYQNVTPDDVAEIIDQHLLEGRPVERLLIPDELWG